MISISQWANRNPVKSRILIAFGHLLAVANALFLGLLFFVNDWPAAPFLAPVLVTIFCGAYLAYPRIKNRVSKKIYWQQKRSDVIMAICYSLLIAVGVNSYLVNEEISPYGEPSVSEVTFLHSAISSPPPAKASAKLAKAQKREARRSQFKALKLQFKELKTQIKTWKKNHKGEKKGNGWGKALLTLLVFIGALVCAYFIALLACSLSCNGMEGLAVVVVIGGLAAIIGLSIIALKSVYKNKPPATV